MDPATYAPTSDDALREALALHGVALFMPHRDGTLAPEEGGDADFVQALAGSDDPRLRAGLTCLLARLGPARARAAVEAAGLEPRFRARLGALHRVARALVISRAPDLERVLRSRPQLEPVDFEPRQLPAPEELLGEATLFHVRQGTAHSLGVDGGIERTFDTWLRLLAVERPT